MLSYDKALAEARRVGASKAEGDAHLAETAATLCVVHRGANPKLIYEGARKRGLSGSELVKLAHKDPVAFGDLMFEL